ncbi:MAG: hypothetical protein HDT43_10645 [Ruminococcaceae bacterium]|nr:hypothetical protein [Oscillospiraceae bacterium]
MKRIIAAIMILVLAVTLSGCKEVPSFMPSYWDGLTKAGARAYIQNALRDKYGEEFVVKELAKRSGYYFTDLLADCSPSSDESLVFQVECWNFKNHDRELIDTYIQSIVGREMRNKAENVLSKYCENFAVEVYVYGLASDYDSKIQSADMATIENFTNALPDDNLSVVWIAFDENEIGDKYDETIKYIEEIVKDFGLSNCYIDCYFVSLDIVNQCNEKIMSCHSGYNYQITADMDTTLSSQRPIYRYVYTGGDCDLALNKILN